MQRSPLPALQAAALVLATALLAHAPAHAGHRGIAYPPGHPVQLSIVDEDAGDSILQAWPDGRRQWVAGTPGHRYAVRMTNTSSRRVLVVLSVDGVNAVSGETAHPSQAGYVIGPWQTVRIDGWRKSMSDVARFVFTDHADAYASRTGRPGNVGVIGIAVFDEARPRHEARPAIGHADTSSRAAPAADAASASRAIATEEAEAQTLGTGHGERAWSPVSQTHFTRASSRPTQVTELRYDARERLIAMGIMPNHRRPTSEPRAFPSGFVADPPDWR
ncbi:hypothetical protein [Marilutibacter aestuarii]|uniref:Uncharacterized protein n=1 Tax=Marilutibacter aestuarii TaxID=1706195 RepID=A0A508A0Z7_9GAMM|nr:hypothetical protein [Lysobacter aestuarii]TQD39502.1 hypothetical protein FKV25_15150 [Lysobacter aestuarii]